MTKENVLKDKILWERRLAKGDKEAPEKLAKIERILQNLEDAKSKKSK